jgi:hypothetical protein
MRIKKGIETKELLLIHKSIGFEDLRYYHHGGDLVIDPKRIFRKQNFDERE